MELVEAGTHAGGSQAADANAATDTAGTPMTATLTDGPGPPANDAAPPPPKPPQVRCPRRKCTGFFSDQTNPARCDTCGKQSNIFTFTPVPMLRLPLRPAGEGDAACAYHPQRKAQTICVATGNYICPLCTVEIAGKAFSAQYLGSPAGEAFSETSNARRLPRPDSMIVNWLVSLFVPPFFYISWYATPVMLPLSIIWYFKARRLRRENALAREVISRARMTVLPILLVVFGLFLAFMILALVMLLLAGRTNM